VFTITLPARLEVRPDADLEAEAEGTRGEAPVAALPPLDGVSVLVVDDDADARTFVCELLEHHGATVVTSDSATDAMRRFRQLRPDVIISDLGMPDEDGYSLIKRVRSLTSHEGGDTPALALTAYVRNQDENAALSAGYHRHVRKPVDVSELVTAVAELATTAKAE
jgi:CheY-like chemotaxis protein